METPHKVGSQLQYWGHLGVKKFDSKRSRWTKTELQSWGWCTDKAARLVTVCSRAASRTNNEWPVSHPYWRCWRRNGSLLFILRQHYHLCRRQTQRHHHCLYVWTSPSQLLYHVQLPVVATETCQFPSNILLFPETNTIYNSCCYQTFQQDSDTGFPTPCTPECFHQCVPTGSGKMVCAEFALLETSKTSSTCSASKLPEF